jgi:hypothetical protein
VRKILISALALVALLLAGTASAQTSDTRYNIVATCGSPPATFQAGKQAPPTMDTNGVACTSNAGAANAVSPVSSATGGATPYHFLSTASTNSHNVKDSAGTVYAVVVISTQATAIAYLKFYDIATAPTCASDTVVFTIATPTLATGAAVTITFPTGLAFATGIGYCITGAAADNDNTNATTGVTLSLAYK